MRSNYFVTDRTSHRVNVTSSITRDECAMLDDICLKEHTTKSEKIRQLLMECIKNSKEAK